MLDTRSGIWFLTADSRGASIYEVDVNSRTLEEVHRVDLPAVDPASEDAEKLAATVGTWLHSAAANAAFGGLVVSAAPALLERLAGWFSTSVQHRVLLSIPTEPGARPLVGAMDLLRARLGALPPVEERRPTWQEGATLF